MFSKTDLEYLQKQPYDLVLVNYHDATIYSPLTGHDWVIMSNYENPGCYILHRHSRRDPYHRQEGSYKNLIEAVDYINGHEKWFAANKM